jgi:lysophospholipase L1-like esterase
MLLYLALLLCTSVGALRVLPLGDSITCGCGSTARASSNWTASCGTDVGGYRVPLWAALTAAGVNATLVGTLSSGPSWAPSAATRHEGHPGWRTAQILAILPAWAATQPDVILIHLGTNDIGQGKPLPGMLADMGALLGNISSALPSARTIVCTILHMVNSEHPEWGPAVAAYNAALPALVAQWPQAALVDLAPTGLCTENTDPRQRLCSQCNPGAACTTNASFYDRVHPTAAGYSVMAGVLAGEVLKLLEG